MELSPIKFWPGGLELQHLKQRPAYSSSHFASSLVLGLLLAQRFFLPLFKMVFNSLQKVPKLLCDAVSERLCRCCKWFKLWHTKWMIWLNWLISWPFASSRGRCLRWGLSSSATPVLAAGLQEAWISCPKLLTATHTLLCLRLFLPFFYSTAIRQTKK